MGQDQVGGVWHSARDVDDVTPTQRCVVQT